VQSGAVKMIGKGEDDAGGLPVPRRKSLPFISVCLYISAGRNNCQRENVCALRLADDLPRSLWREDARGEEREEEEDEGTMDCGAPQEWVKDVIEEVGGFTAAFSSRQNEKNRWK
jgi:hypothetical protein